MCSEFDRWYKYVKENKGDKKYTYQSALILVINLSIFVCASKGQSIETTSQCLKN
jgi:hypothetical protein